MIGTERPLPERFPAVFVPSAALAALALFAGCSSGGGGGAPNAAPTIVAAAYVGGGTPQAGETLLLTFSEDVAVRASTLLTDADVTLSGGGTLGDVTAVPTATNARSITVTLGSGVTFTPGTTTITLSAANDAIADATGKLGEAGTAVVIGTSDGVAPTLSNVTIAAIDGELNGTGTAGGTLQVPPNGWTIDLTFADNTGVTATNAVITANVSVATTTAGTQAAGANLVPVLTLQGSSATTASFLVPTTVTFPGTAFTLSCTVVDDTGLASSAVTFAATSRAFVDPLRPFETAVNPSQVWFLDFTRDVESFSTSSITGGVSVDVSTGANGVSDFEDILRIIGLNATVPVAQNGACVGGVNAKAQDVYKANLLADLATLYSGANIGFTLTQPAGSFGSQSSLSYNSFGYSQISVAGSASSPGVLGVAIFDESNTTQDDDTLTDFGGIRLGIFLHTIADAGLGPPAASAFRMTFGGLAPALGGTPLGGDADDCQRLDGAVNDSRKTLLDTALADFARFTAVIIAHECGHSMGLVQNGAMPNGLYGNDTGNFPGSSDGHIRNTSLFPAGATNVMSPSLTYSSTVNPLSTFNSLNLAYLREQVFYGN
ncbi:MAG: hypothetical protein KDE27_18355 [Planctomycetes bacterium]|nr:hypothetical protein [Planctomycetota bacterium]